MDHCTATLVTDRWADVTAFLCGDCHHGIKRKWADMCADDNDGAPMDELDATYEFTVVVTKRPRPTIRALPPEVILLILERTGVAYGPVVESVCREWHRVWGGRHHFADERPPVEWALRGHKALLEWALNQGWIDRGEGIAAAAARGGHRNIVRWCLKRGLDVGPETCEALARDGYQYIIKEIRDKGGKLTYPMCVAAAEGGHLDLLQWACDSGCYHSSTEICAAAARNGHRWILEWALSRSDRRRDVSGKRWDSQTCAAAAGAGRLELLQWLRANKCPWNCNTIGEAARNGHVDIIRWARDNGCEWDSYALALAAYGGDLELVRWMIDGGCPCGAGASDYAASGGHIHILGWLRDRGHEQKYDSIMSSAAEAGQLSVIRWAHAVIGGDPGDEESCNLAACEGHVAVLDWFHENGCAREHIAGSLLDAAYWGRLDVLRWARARGYDWDARMCANAAAEGRLGTLRWLRREGCPWDATACENAASFGRLRVLRWAVEHGCPWDPAKCVDLVRERQGSKRHDATQAWIEFQLHRLALPLSD